MILFLPRCIVRRTLAAAQVGTAQLETAVAELLAGVGRQ